MKVGDSSAVSQFEKSQSQNRQSGGVVNVLLYVGFVLVSLGLIMTFVGMGERGFKTEDLKLIGPSLIGSGILFGFLRILFCSIPKNACSRKKPLDEKSLLSPSQETLGEQAPSPPKPPRKLPPIKNDNANKTEKLFKDKEILETLDTENRCEEIHEMQNNTEDEVESDSDLGLDVDYIQEHKSNKSSRPNSSKSVNTQD
ncbi:hypothetical protein Avbf_08450 [Armadillidium vulgare]|nr:hypothetical protein Avbf_08450 [Armadillidium vulgare]